MKIAIQGELGSFSHQAALKFEPGATIRQCVLASDAFELLEEHAVGAIALPIENTLAGSVVEHYDLLLTGGTHITREVVMRIKHTLIGLPGSALGSVHRVYSHPVALAQCRRFFAEHPGMEAIPFYDTAGAVKELMELRDRHVAAIASEHAAYVYGGEVLASAIEDNPANFTRFLLIRRADIEEDQGGPDAALKLTLAFRLRHEVGALAAALTAVAGAQANVTKIQSRPVQGEPWVYTFYLDGLVAGWQGADEVLKALRAHSSFVKELGRYQPASEDTRSPVM